MAALYSVKSLPQSHAGLMSRVDNGLSRKIDGAIDRLNTVPPQLRLLFLIFLPLALAVGIMGGYGTLEAYFGWMHGDDWTVDRDHPRRFTTL